MGLYLGIGGVVTFKNAKKLKEVVAYAPLEQLVLETDSPYLSPEPNRGKRNSSLNLPYVAEAIAQIKGCSRGRSDCSNRRECKEIVITEITFTVSITVILKLRPYIRSRTNQEFRSTNKKKSY